jgi:2-polyprenyl-3-methyl-5-hydroxy-6-metoxy-1,4-benzoquinol methylase
MSKPVTGNRPKKRAEARSFRARNEVSEIPLAPVALFVYNRPVQVKRVLESLRQNDVSKLYIFSDGPKGPADARGVNDVRKLVRSIRWISPEVVERPANHGIRESMLLGLELVFKREDRVIVIEDDISVAPEFCAFMNVCLDRYCDSDRIAGVTGLRYPFDREVFRDYPYDVFLSPRFSSWGWGTWKRWWQAIDFDHDRAVSWLATATDDELRVAGPDVPAMARYLAEGGAKWGATTADAYSLIHMIRNQQFFVCPTWNMVDNLGFSEGTHVSSRASQSWSLEWETKNDFTPEALRLPDDLRLTTSVWEAFEAFLESLRTAPSVSERRRSASDIARLVVKDVTPLVALRMRRVLRAAVIKPLRRAATRRPSLFRRLHPPEVARKSDPGEYTTTDGPIEVPLQKETYYLALNEYVEDGDRVLDVGCGIGYGLNLLSIKAREVVGVDVDAKAIEYCRTHVLKKNPKLAELHHYDGYHLPYEDGAFDVVICVDVVEHVERYEEFVAELLRVAKKRVIFGTPNRRPEFTNPDGTPKNYWHLREWSYEELDEILRRHVSQIDWHFINGAWEGPFTVSRTPTDFTQALVPAVVPEPHG